MSLRIPNGSGDGLVSASPFQSFLMGGFECSTLCLQRGERIDMVDATQHDKFALLDYKRMQSMGLLVAREGLRWHLIEHAPGRYDFSSVQPIVQAARVTGTQVIWDLCHFGWPDDLDIWKPEFVERLAQYTEAFIKWLARETDGPGFFVPINEISFFSWAGGEEGNFRPGGVGRGYELKQQLVRASLAATDVIRALTPEARTAVIDPIIHVIASPSHPEEQSAAEAYRGSQYQAWDMLAGIAAPELGGNPTYLDIIGVNFYPHNQWFYNLEGHRCIRKFRAITRTSPHYRPLREMLTEIYQRYRRPLLVAETGTENRLRTGWFRYVCHEVHAAIAEGIPVLGICLYPIVNHPGWVDCRHCHNALWDYPDESGRRKIYEPLAREIRKAHKLFRQPDRVALEQGTAEPELLMH